MPFLSLVTFDLDLQTRPSQRGIKHVFRVNMAQICSVVPEIFQTQTNNHRLTAPKTTFRSSLRAVIRKRKELKVKFHYAIWFEAGSKLVADRSATSFEPASNQLRTRLRNGVWILDEQKTTQLRSYGLGDTPWNPWR